MLFFVGEVMNLDYVCQIDFGPVLASTDTTLEKKRKKSSERRSKESCFIAQLRGCPRSICRSRGIIPTVVHGLSKSGLSTRSPGGNHWYGDRKLMLVTIVVSYVYGSVLVDRWLH